ncbi:hypothetical protein B0H13DRAFT_2414083 [Mycena leptocephala]|nr:hypothetical protein B0H13DRAFT_2414083 [Mycena leptocephala]
MLAALEVDRARVADLEAQISHLERSLSALREEKTLAQERLDSYKYPVLELPNEIVSDVFMHFLPPYPLFPPLIGLLSPTLLTQICRRWREIALGTPALWRAISSYHESIHIPYDLVIHAFDTWLNRSGCCPVSLRLDANDSQIDVAEFLAILVPHRARWENLDLHLSLSHLPILDGPMPLLCSLDLRLSDSSAHVTEAVSFREMPLLRTVVLSDDVVLSVILPWAQLTSLTLLCVYPYECVPILRQTSSLIRCKLLLCCEFDELRPDIALPCLESLTLELADPGAVTDFLETFIVPALHSLEIPEDFLYVNPIESLAAFISKSGCKLEEVHITGPRSVPSSSYLKAFPSIPRFSFSDEESSNSSDVEDDLDSEIIDGTGS